MFKVMNGVHNKFVGIASIESDAIDLARCRAINIEIGFHLTGVLEF